MLANVKSALPFPYIVALEPKFITSTFGFIFDLIVIIYGLSILVLPKSIEILPSCNLLALIFESDSPFTGFS